LLQLLKQSAVNVAFASFLGYQVPKVAYLGLADTVYTAEALLNPVWVPWEVVIDHQVGTLKVNPLARGIRGNEHVHFRIMFERLLCLQAFLAAHTAVDDHNSLLAAEQGGDAGSEVAQACRDAR